MRAEYDFTNARRGPLFPPQPGTSRVTIRLDDAVLDWFKDKVEAAGGGNYQTLINMALREHIRDANAHLEETVRRIVREELAAAGPEGGRAKDRGDSRQPPRARAAASPPVPAPRRVSKARASRTAKERAAAS